MESIQDLANSIYRERVLRARRTPPEQKLLAGPELFAWACSIMADGIRNEHPDADENRVQQIVRERLALGRRLRESS